MLNRDEQNVILPAASAYASALVFDVRGAQMVTLSCQYTCGAGALNGQAEFYIELFQGEIGGTMKSLGVECIRSESPASSGHMKVARNLDHQTRTASGVIPTAAAAEQVWCPASVCADEVRITAREIGDVAKPGTVAFRMNCQ